ncbi:hypothetical protein JOD63_002138 [Microbacterium terrae]|nr:hypothetical protein [Microbacterium terrae]MBP1078170.1 hypothetical protein [Microbacterium terrae]
MAERSARSSRWTAQLLRTRWFVRSPTVMARCGSADEALSFA